MTTLKGTSAWDFAGHCRSADRLAIDPGDRELTNVSFRTKALMKTSVRGGSWGDWERYLRAAYSDLSYPGIHGNSIGFRTKA